MKMKEVMAVPVKRRKNSMLIHIILLKWKLNENCKIDNLVHIAHGVEIGENSLIIANSMIAGSTVVGDSCWVAPSSSILNNTYFGSNSMCGMGSVIIKNVENNSLVVGVPAKKIKNL